MITERVLLLSKKQDLNKGEKLELGEFFWNHKHEGNNYLNNLSKKLNINYYTLRDWMWSYEAYKTLPIKERDSYSLNELKVIIKKIRKEKPKHIVAKKEVPKRKIEFYEGLYDVYEQLKKIDCSLKNTDKIKKILFISNLIKSEAKKILQGTNEILQEIPEDFDELDINSLSEDDIAKVING